MDKETFPNQDVGSDESTKPRRVKDLFAWKSLNRPMWSYSKDVFTTLGIIAILVGIICAFFQQWTAILVIGASYFLFYALSKVPPVEVEHKITTEGIVSMGKGYLWSELGPFWFSDKGRELILHVAHRSMFGQLILLVDRKDQEEIKDVLAEYLAYIEIPEKSMTEKVSEWFSKKFPIERIVAKDFKAPTEPHLPPKSPPQI
jgi:hypothetical protein